MAVTGDAVAISDLLSEALVHAENSDTIIGMLYCRHSLEALAHHICKMNNVSFEEDFVSFAKMMKRIKPLIDREDNELMWSINSRTRGSMHYQKDDTGARSSDIPEIVFSIERIYKNNFKEPLKINKSEKYSPSTFTKLIDGIPTILLEDGYGIEGAMLMTISI